VGDDEVRARVELRALIDAYALALDERDVPALLSLFHPDAVLATHLPGEERGDPIYRGTGEIGRVMDVLARFDETMHLMHNHTVVVAGDGGRATGLVLCVAHHLYEEDGAPHDLVMGIRYRDRYARDADGRWKFADRRIVRHFNAVQRLLDERRAF
jgi:ketosteroid isomerase-like protein